MIAIKEKPNSFNVRMEAHRLVSLLLLPTILQLLRNPEENFVSSSFAAFGDRQRQLLSSNNSKLNDTLFVVFCCFL